jgi:eukaryotic-like serine/threonine-protein kinase
LLAAHEQSDGVLASHAEANRPTITLELSDLPDPAVGQTIGRYKLLEKLGEGGCGVVYVAEQTEPVRRRVALKVIKLGMDTRRSSPASKPSARPWP